MERRPGGLTALAVFNFIWALRTGLGSIGLLLAATLLSALMLLRGQGEGQ